MLDKKLQELQHVTPIGFEGLGRQAPFGAEMAQPSLDLGRYFGRYEIGHSFALSARKAGDSRRLPRAGCCRSLGQIDAFPKTAPNIRGDRLYSFLIARNRRKI